MFSLGLFSAHIYTRVQLNQTFQRDLKQLNTLNLQKQELLDTLHGELKDIDPPVASHVLALKQKAVAYDYGNLLVISSEQNQLQEFYFNFLTIMGRVYPKQGLTSETLLILEQNLKEQRNKTISSLSDLL